MIFLRSTASVSPSKIHCSIEMSLGRLGWLVIGTFHASLLIGTDLYLAGPSVESVRHGGADGRHLIPENNRHSRCDDDGSRDDGHGHGVVHPANMRLRGTQASRIPCHDQTDPTTGGPRCGALAGHPVSRPAYHRPEDCLLGRQPARDLAYDRDDLLAKRRVRRRDLALRELDS